MDTSIVSQIAALRRMCASELQAEWIRLYGEPARSRNCQFLFRRLAWRIQELQLGGLSDRARLSLDELAPENVSCTKTPSGARSAASPVPPADRSQSRRDSRLPSPGTVIRKAYKGTELRVTVRDDGYEYNGAMFGSLTALAKQVTGSKSINGKLFFGLTTRKCG